MWTLKSSLTEASWVRLIRADDPRTRASVDAKAMRILGVLSVAHGAHVLRFHIVLAIEPSDGLASDCSS